MVASCARVLTTFRSQISGPSTRRYDWVTFVFAHRNLAHRLSVPCELCTGASCNWVRNNWNTDGEIKLGPFSGTHSQCIEAVIQQCPNATIANYYDRRISADDDYGYYDDDDYASCWCQYGVDMRPDPDVNFVSCLLSGVMIDGTYTCLFFTLSGRYNFSTTPTKTISVSRLLL
jgi:hypothetical protein